MERKRGYFHSRINGHRISRGKGKGKAIQNDSTFKNIRFIIVIDRAERLKDTNPDPDPLTGLAKMVL